MLAVAINFGLWQLHQSNGHIFSQHSVLTTTLLITFPFTGFKKFNFSCCINFSCEPTTLHKSNLTCIRTVARKSSIVGLNVCAGGLDIENLIKTPLIHIGSHFNLGGSVFPLGGLNHQSPPVAKGLLCMRLGVAALLAIVTRTYVQESRFHGNKRVRVTQHEAEQPENSWHGNETLALPISLFQPLPCRFRNHECAVPPVVRRSINNKDLAIQETSVSRWMGCCT